MEIRVFQKALEKRRTALSRDGWLEASRHEERHLYARVNELLEVDSRDGCNCCLCRYNSCTNFEAGLG